MDTLVRIKDLTPVSTDKTFENALYYKKHFNFSFNNVLNTINRLEKLEVSYNNSIDDCEIERTEPNELIYISVYEEFINQKDQYG